MPTIFLFIGKSPTFLLLFLWIFLLLQFPFSHGVFWEKIMEIMKDVCDMKVWLNKIYLAKNITNEWFYWCQNVKHMASATSLIKWQYSHTITTQTHSTLTSISNGSNLSCPSSILIIHSFLVSYKITNISFGMQSL